jgi:hypothetical protein
VPSAAICRKTYPTQGPRSAAAWCRLRYGGYANQWGFAIYRASHDDYQDSFLPTGMMGGTAEDALDTACGLCFADPTAWISPPKN